MLISVRVLVTFEVRLLTSSLKRGSGQAGDQGKGNFLFISRIKRLGGVRAPVTQQRNVHLGFELVFFLFIHCARNPAMVLK